MMPQEQQILRQLIERFNRLERRVTLLDTQEGGGGAVDSVNGATGVVVLDTDDIAEGATNLYLTQERVEDYVAGQFTGNTGIIDATYNDATGAITLTLDVSAADKYLYSTAADTWAEGTITSFARTLLDDTTAALARGTLGLAIGVDVQGYDGELAALAGLTSAADRLPYFTGSGTAALATFTSAARNLLDDADAAAMRTTLELVAGATGDIWVEKAGDTMTGNLAVASTATTGNSLNVTRNLAAASTNDAVVEIVQDHASDDQPALVVQQDGTGDIVTLFDGATEVVAIEDGGIVDIGQYGASVFAGGSAALKVAGDTNGILSFQLKNKNTGTTVDARFTMVDSDGDATLSFALPGKNYSGTLFGVNRKDAGFLFTNWTTLTRMLVLGTVGATDIVLGTTNTERARVTSGGDFGIGTSTVSARLHVHQGTLGNEVQRLTSTATNDDPRESVYQARGTTTSAVTGTIFSLAIPASTTVAAEAVVIARRTGGTSGTAEDGAAYIVRGVWKNVAGTATIIGSYTTTVIGESQASWHSEWNESGGDANLWITGAANNNITWHATIRVWQLSS